MRRFIFCPTHYTSKSIDQIEAGNIGVYSLNDGEFTLLQEGVKPGNIMNIVVGRKPEEGGNICVPIYKNAFSFSSMNYESGNTYYSEINVPTPNFVGDYSIIVAKKGVNFNERNKWTATVHVSENDIDGGMTAVQLAEKLVKSINGNIGSGISASNEEALIMLEGNKVGVDYKIITADNMYGVNVTEEEHASVAKADYAYIKDLATKAAASAGFTDTFEDSVDFYKNYPFTIPSEEQNSTEFIVYTLKFAEPRNMKTVDTAINQVVQVVIKGNLSTSSYLDAAFKAIAENTTIAVSTPE